MRFCRILKARRGSIATSANSISYLNLVVSENGLSEFNDGNRVIFIPKEQVQQVELEYGSRAERPLAQVVLGLILLALGLAGLYLIVAGSVRGIIWGLGFLTFGCIGFLCLYEALKKGHYLRVTCPTDFRKLKFTGTIQPQALSKFIQDASALGYGIRHFPTGANSVSVL